jgi:Ca2+/Na+ antiporter
MIRFSILAIVVAILVLGMATGLRALFIFLVAFLYCSFLVWWIVSNPVVEDDEEDAQTPPHKL